MHSTPPSIHGRQTRMDGGGAGEVLEESFFGGLAAIEDIGISLNVLYIRTFSDRATLGYQDQLYTQRLLLTLHGGKSMVLKDSSASNFVDRLFRIHKDPKLELEGYLRQSSIQATLFDVPLQTSCRWSQELAVCQVTEDCSLS